MSYLSRLNSFRSALVAILCSIAYFANDASAQIHRTYDFHTIPLSLHVNEFVSEANVMYYYSDELGYIYTARRNNRISIFSNIHALGHVMSYCFSDAKRGWACGIEGIVFTTDSGMSWNRVNGLKQAKAEWRQVYFADATKTLYAISMREGVWTSLDYGTTWQRIRLGEYTGVGFHGFSGVLTSVKIDETCYTTDGGNSWHRSDPFLSHLPAAYYEPDEVFLAIAADNSIYRSAIGKSWEFVEELRDQPASQIYPSCTGIYLPLANRRYYAGVPGALRRYGTGSFTTDLVAAYAHGKLYYFWGDAKPRLNSTSRPGLRIKIEDTLRVLVSRCDSTVRSITATLDPIYGLTSDYKVEIVNPDPAISIKGESMGLTDSAITFILVARKLEDTVEAIVRIAVDGCLDASKQIVVQFIPRTDKLALTTNDIAFGAISTCASSIGWLRIENPDCNPMDVTRLDLRQAAVPFRVLDTRPLPITIPGQQLDSIQVEFAPEKLGAVSNFIDLACKFEDTLINLTSKLTGSGAGTASATPSSDSVRFGTVSRCVSANRVLTLRNTGCERLKIKAIYLPAVTQFILARSPEGKWLEPGEEAEVELGIQVNMPGVFDDELVAIMSDAAGSSIICRMRCVARVEDTPAGYDLNNSMELGTISTCSVLDTLISITNTSVCDTLSVANVAISGQGLSLPDPETAFKLEPGETREIPLRIVAEDLTQVTGEIAIETDLFGFFMVPITGTILQSILREATIAFEETLFRTTQCLAVSKTFRLSTRGCGILHLEDVKLVTGDGSPSKFLLSTAGPTFPLELTEVEQLVFTVLYDPEGIGLDVADILILGPDDQQYQRLALRGEVESTLLSLGLTMQRETPEDVTSSDEVVISIGATQTVQPSQRLVDLTTELVYDRDVLTLKSVSSAFGNVVQSDIGDALQLRIENSAGFEFAAGQELARLNFQPRITESSSSTIEIRGLQLNNGDPDFERCVMASTPVAELSQTSLILDCGERVVQRGLRNERILRIDRVYPHPVRPGGSKIELTAQVGMTAEVRFIDALGHTIIDERIDLKKGRNTIQTSAHLRTGAYQLIVTEKQRTVARHSFVVQ